ncbi:MAG TPA: arabinose transporter permease [Anaerolineaceae bacterium]|nr:arabinose transporter permease [Anaerolineaceae bacterium]
MKSKLNSQKVAPYIFVLPFVLIFLIFFVYSIGSTVLMSFQSVHIGDIQFVKLENFRMLFNNSSFPIAIRNSLVYTALTLLLLIPFPMTFAVMLNSKSMRGSGLFRAILFLPLLCSVVVAGITFRFMFSETNASLVNSFVINVLGGEKVPWVRLQWPAMILLVTLASWRWTGINVIYFLSGLNSIPVELYEASEIDGANTWQRFRYLTIPMLKPTIIYVLTISIYGGLAMFAESQMIWAGKSSPHNVGLTIVGFIYQNGISQGNLGLASATGLLLLLAVLIINLVQLRLTGVIGKEND